MSSPPPICDGVGFKTVLGRDLTGCVPADERVIAALEGFKEIAPAHNPPYARASGIFHEKLPGVPLVALFETAFYQWVPEAATRYAVPESWYRAGVRRYGFHGASHKFVAERSAELLGRRDVAERVRHLYQAGAAPLGAGRRRPAGDFLPPGRQQLRHRAPRRHRRRHEHGPEPAVGAAPEQPCRRP